MEAKELRIGNCVMCDGKIISLRSRDIYHVDKSGLKVSPVPLTEDRLIDFGFVKMDNKDGLVISVGGYELYVVQNGFSGTLDKEPSWFCSVATGYGSQPMSLVKMYVHEIQNLYFALTGKELTKKEQ